jgi:hypothetical protein
VSMFPPADLVLGPLSRGVRFDSVWEYLDTHHCLVKHE